MKKWECHDLGKTTEFLQMKIHQDGRWLAIDQCKYLEKVLEHCKMINTKPACTPLPEGYKPNPELQTWFQTVIGSLLYLMLGTHPDIAYAVTLMVWMSANPIQEHLDKALYVCCYLIGTHDYSLVFNGNSGNGLITCTDSDWAGSPEDSKFTTGFYIKLANAVFLWNSHQQKTVALLSTEAEYMALSNYSCQVVWIRNMFGKIGFNLLPMPICGDNQGSIFMRNNPVTECCTKHIPIRFHYVRDTVQKCQVEIFYIEGTDNSADTYVHKKPWICQIQEMQVSIRISIP